MSEPRVSSPDPASGQLRSLRASAGSGRRRGLRVGSVRASGENSGPAEQLRAAHATCLDEPASIDRSTFKGTVDWDACDSGAWDRRTSFQVIPLGRESDGGRCARVTADHGCLPTTRAISRKAGLLEPASESPGSHQANRSSTSRTKEAWQLTVCTKPQPEIGAVQDGGMAGWRARVCGASRVCRAGHASAPSQDRTRTKECAFPKMGCRKTPLSVPPAPNMDIRRLKSVVRPRVPKPWPQMTLSSVWRPQSGVSKRQNHHSSVQIPAVTKGAPCDRLLAKATVGCRGG